MLHILKAKEQNNAPLIICDPRFTRTAAHADEYVRFRPGTDVGLIWGIMWHIFENGWEDKEFIRQRVYGMDDVMDEVKKMDSRRDRTCHRCSRFTVEACCTNHGE